MLHLGSGASACAIRAGASLDTSMGLTPLSGLPGATRSGAVDPSLIFHYTNRAGRITHERAAAVDVHVTEAEDILNKHAGWAALTGTPDFAVVVRNMKEARGAGGEWEGEGRWRLAFELFVDRIAGFVGEYFVKLGGEVDALVFAGGIGEKSVELREAVAAKAACLGFELDAEANAEAGQSDAVVTDVGTGRGTRRVLVCRTDEQVRFAPHSVRLRAGLIASSVQLEMAKECALADKFWE